jgi:uncharacterized protein YndB with AHSA1/START domain
VIEAERGVVWRAWTAPQGLLRWYRPDDAWSTPTAEVDLREGGAYRIGLQPPGRPMFYEVGRFREVSPPHRLTYTVRFEGPHRHEVTGEDMETYETLITAVFDEEPPGRTRVRVLHEGYRTREDRDRHLNGWPRFLDHLATYCAGDR